MSSDKRADDEGSPEIYDVGVTTLVVTYDPLADTAYIRFSDEEVADTRGTVIPATYHLDAEGHIVGVELFNVLTPAGRQDHFGGSGE